jgi:NAD(P)-dependent dehydrogenase (short-subunit alcohol dehydrogenase family)
VPGRMEGKKVVVVGAGQQPGGSTGNGRAIAVQMAREGAEVCAVDRLEDRARETVEQIASEGGDAHVVVADVAEASDCAALVDQSVLRMGRVDVLVNNVGVTSGDGHPAVVSEAAWQRIMDLNLRSMWLTTRAVVPGMQEQGGGAITNISSTGARVGSSVLFAYGIAKAGVDALTHAIAREYAPWGIRCNSVLPGAIDTPLGVEEWVARGDGPSRDEVVAQRGRNVPLGHMGTAWDVAHAVVFLSSDEAAFITGTHLPVDGGTLAYIGTFRPPRRSSQTGPPT